MTMQDDDKRRRFCAFCLEHDLVASEWEATGFVFPPPAFPVFPDDLRGLKCGARTRAGRRCKLTAIYENGRCKWHGGCSTGPRTEAGKEQARINGRKGGRRKRGKPKS